MLCFLLLKKNYKVRKKEKRKRKIIEFPKRNSSWCGLNWMVSVE